MHSNFKNLDPIYEKIRFEKAEGLANIWLRSIGATLKARVEDIIRK
jgi:hypothetical protein